MKNTSTITLFVISFLVVGSLATVFLLLDKQQESPEPTTSAAPVIPGTKVVTDQPQTDPPTKEEIEKETTQPPPVLRSIGKAKDLADAIARAIHQHDADMLRELKDKSYITPEQAEALRELIAIKHVKLSSPQTSDIGSNNQNKSELTRFSLNFINGARGYLDIVKTQAGSWSLKSLNLPGKQELSKDKTSAIGLEDAMGITTSFMQAVARADFTTARRYTDRSKVQNATIAGLCILFEEGTFRMRQNSPVKTAYENDTIAGYFVHLQNGQGQKAGNIGITLANTDKQWLITEIALDSMLEAYTKQQGAGDDFFIPIVKNPKGGDSLALFFGFNEDTLSPRSIRQLYIVAEAIKLDAEKKLEISGHTDDVGGDSYNQSLSERRATAVKQVLVQAGIPSERIVTKGFGKSQPRRTYLQNAADADKDEARKENRRAEMYLDF